MIWGLTISDARKTEAMGHWDIKTLRLGQTDADMTLDDRTIAEDLTLHLMSIIRYQEKDREIVPQKPMNNRTS